MKAIIGVPEVSINWVSVEVDNLEEALGVVENGVPLDDILEISYSHTLESDEFKVRLPSGEEVSFEEAQDREAAGERIGG
jgi:hypothetical protein